MVLATVWFLWGQEERFWSYKLLNIIPGPTRGSPYIVGDFESQDACFEAYFKKLFEDAAVWRLPEMEKKIKEFGGLWRHTLYACVPAPFKPERIDTPEAGQWNGSWR
jgi:hypothetical protein